MKKLSLRMRLTLTVLIIITAIALMLTLVAMYNSKKMNADVVEGITISMQAEHSGIDIIDQQSDFFIIEGEVPSLLSGNSSPMEMDSMIVAFETMQNRFDYTSIIFMLIIIVAAGIITYFALGRGLKPVKQLSSEIEGITENELNVRISNFDSNDEISKLADSFNILMERLEKAFSEQKNFSTSAAHELKTPLAAIKANIDVLEMDADPTSEEYAQTISVVKKQTERMTALVDDLFSFSSGDYDIADNVNLSDIINIVIEDFAHPIQEKDLNISLDLKMSDLVKTNRSILQHILSNLIGNAVKYTESKGEICITTEEDDTGYIIKIADNGIGISPEYAEKIFQPFVRVDESRSRKAGGAGLGLAIAKSMAEKIGGTICVSANAPKGSIFSLHILK